ncbi:Protein NUT [Tupaia chinensis]|uniref:Protein NUT n=2 Tax=Tupaia chinensis TaxID=246437 RepID=L9LB23_TUPCH|nr:Protein NUT [Tupaia chinensis]
MTLKLGATLSPFTTLPFSPPTPGAPDQPPWEPPPQPPLPSAFSPSNPLVLSAFPNPLLVTGDMGPGSNGAGAGKVIVKVKTEGGLAEPSQTQNFILTQTALNWIASGACGGPEAPPPRFVATSNVKTALLTKAAGVNQEGPPGLPHQAPPPVAQLAPILPLEKAWLGPHGTSGEGGPTAARSKPSLGELPYTSKGVYENFRRWQRYKALARRHLSQTPDVEALSCFLIPVLRSLARLKPTMTLEEGLPRAVQEWEHTSNFDRMIFYEMAEKFMEFEAEEEMQIQNAQLMSGSQGLSPATPLKLEPPGPPAPEVCQQPVYIPKKVASKTRAPRRRQCKAQRPPIPEAPKEIPPEAVKEYADIMEGLVGSHLATGALNTKWEEQQQEEEEMYPDPSLLNYIDELCSQEVFVSKVEAVIHPRFLTDLLSPEQQRDPLTLTEELEQEEGLTLAQLVQKRLLALEEEEVAEAAPSCSGAQSNSSPSVSDEDEDGSGRLRPSPGPQGAGSSVLLGKAASPGERAREVHGGQEQALDSPRGMCRDENTLQSSSSWDLQLELAAPQGTQGPLGIERTSGMVINQVSPHQDSHLGVAGSPGHCLAANRTSETLPLCWLEDPQPEDTPGLDDGFAEQALLQGQELEEQVLGLQTEQMGDNGLLPQGKEPLTVPQEGSSGAMWGDDGGPPMVQGCDQNPSPIAARDGDRASFSPELWLSSELDVVGLELPLQIEEVIDSFQDREGVTEHQGSCQVLGPRSTISVSPAETTAPGDVGSGEIPCEGTDATDGLEKRDYCSLPGSVRANRPDLGSKEKREQSPETTQEDPRDLWAEGCSSLLESKISTSALGSSKEVFLSACRGTLLNLGSQDASFLVASQEARSRGNSLSPLLETTEHVNILDMTDDCGLQLGISEETCPPNSNPYDPQGEGKEDTHLSKPKDLAPLQENEESYTLRTPKSPCPPQGLRSISSVQGTRDALALKESSPVSQTHSSAEGTQGKEKKEEEDEELSDFAYLLASKLSLSPRGLLSPRHASGGRGSQRASHSLSVEAGGLGQLPYPIAKSGKQVVARGAAPAEKMPHPGAQPGTPGEKPSVPGVVRPSQPRKRRRDSFVTGRRKKRRRSQ